MEEDDVLKTAAGTEETDEDAETEEGETVEETSAAAVSLNPGDADVVVTVGANVRVGPGLGYGTIAGGVQAGDKLSLLGRNDDASWFNVILPDGETEGWVFASLVTVNSDVEVSALPVIEAPPLVASNPGSGDDGGGTAPPPVVAPISNSGFELGGQAFGAPYGMMNYAGMNWIKRQHKWGSGNTGQDVAGVISEAHNAGFKILLSIPGGDHSNIDYDAYVSFLGQVAGLPDPPDAIEVWNEQNIDREWPSGQISPANYVNNMLVPAYNAIKAANPNGDGHQRCAGAHRLLWWLQRRRL